MPMISPTNTRVGCMGALRAPSTNLTCFARCLVKRFPGFRLNATFNSTIQRAWTRLHGLTDLYGFLEVFGKVWTKLKWPTFRHKCKVTEHHCFFFTGYIEFSKALNLVPQNPSDFAAKSAEAWSHRYLHQELRPRSLAKVTRSEYKVQNDTKHWQ